MEQTSRGLSAVSLLGDGPMHVVLPRVSCLQEILAVLDGCRMSDLVGASAVAEDGAQEESLFRFHVRGRGLIRPDGCPQPLLKLPPRSAGSQGPSGGRAVQPHNQACWVQCAAGESASSCSRAFAPAHNCPMLQALASLFSQLEADLPAASPCVSQGQSDSSKLEATRGTKEELAELMAAFCLK
jgi:hypothetical protein